MKINNKLEKEHTMIRYSLRSDSEIKNLHIVNSHETFNLSAYQEKIPILQNLLEYPQSLKMLKASLGPELYSKLKSKAMFKIHCYYKEQELFIINPTSKEIKLKNFKVKESYQLSPFAFLRSSNSSLLLECPKSYYYLSLTEPKLGIIVSFLAKEITYSNLVTLAKKNLFCQTRLNLFLSALDYIQALVEKNEKLKFWEFHDLLFHAKSRKDRHANGIIRPYRFKELPPDPLLHNSYSKHTIGLPCPQEIDQSFSQILARRRSRRDFNEQKIKLKTLSTFLHHSLQVQKYREDQLGGISFRPSASAGALHGLENYLVVRRCTNLSQGLYYYNPFEHYLEKIKVSQLQFNKLLENARRMAAAQVQPAVYIVTTARFKRYQYKYASLAYSVMLKDLGCQAQTMNLVAEALDLSGVILGDSPIEPLASILNLDYFSEGVVGSFALATPLL